MEEFFLWALSLDSVPEDNPDILTIRLDQKVLRKKLLQMFKESKEEAVAESKSVVPACLTDFSKTLPPLEKTERPKRTRKTRSFTPKNIGMTSACFKAIEACGPAGIHMQELINKMRDLGFEFPDIYLWQLLSRNTRPGGKLRTSGIGRQRMYYWVIQDSGRSEEECNGVHGPDIQCSTKGSS